MSSIELSQPYPTPKFSSYGGLHDPASKTPLLIRHIDTYTGLTPPDPPKTLSCRPTTKPHIFITGPITELLRSPHMIQHPIAAI